MSSHSPPRLPETVVAHIDRDTAPPATRSRRKSAMTLVAAAVMVQAMTAPGQTVGISVFVDHLVNDLDVSRSAVSTAYFLGTLLGATTMPVVGRFIDRRSPRHAIRVFAVVFGLALMAMSGVIGIITLAIGFTVTRALGQGALTLAATTSIAVGFDRARGTAMGIKSAASAGLMSLVPLIATVTISAVGWRLTWLVFGLAVWAVILPLTATSAFTSRSWVAPRQPVLRSQRPADPVVPATAAVQSAELTRLQPSISPSTALRTWPFWSLTAAVSTSALVGTGLVFHHVALMAERGLTPAQAAANFVPQTLAGAGAALLAGRLADRVPPRLLLTIAMSILATTPLLIQFVGPGLTAIAYGLALGGTTAAIRAIEATVMPRWFGLAGIGELRGIVMAVSVAASALGPLALALSIDILGAYQPGLVVFAVASAALAVSSAFTRPPRV